MQFFNQINQLLTEDSPVTLRLVRNNGQMVVSLLPDNVENVPPLMLKGTPDELDEHFFNSIQSPMEKVAGLTSNAEEFEVAVEEAKEAPPAKKIDKSKPVKGKGGGKKKGEVNAAAPAEETPAAAEPGVAPAEVPGTETHTVAPAEAAEETPAPEAEATETPDAETAEVVNEAPESEPTTETEDDSTPPPSLFD